MSRALRTTLNRALLLVGVFLCVWLILFAFLSARDRSKDDLGTGPVVLSIQQIGQLHAISFQMKDVLRQETHEDPDGWVSALPGASSVVHWATHNEAVVVADGSVEAGVDLSLLTAKDVTRTRLEDGSEKLQIKLPPVTIYPPNVHLHVVNNQAGMFWRDEQILPKAQIKAEQIFRSSAEQGGIVAAAKANTIRTLEGVERALGRKNIEFTF